MENIEEIIADARAEEEARRAVEESRHTLEDNDPFAAVPTTSYGTVTIDLAEYVDLKNKEKDIERLVRAICDDMKLSYNKEYLVINGDRIEETFRALYPDTYEIIFQGMKYKEE